MAGKIKVQELDSATQELLLSVYKGVRKIARFGDAGYLVAASFKEDASVLRELPVRPDDVWVVTFPRSGTTFTQELVWLLKNDFDFATASKVPLLERYIFLGMNRVSNPELVKIIRNKVPTKELLEAAPSPRFIKSHLALSLLPAGLLDTARIVYVARDPRDVAVSYYHYNRLMKNYTGDFKTFWNLFIDDLVLSAPFFPHLKEAWAVRHHPHMLFIFYEDLIKDLPSAIKRIATFLETKVTDDQITKLCEHLNIDNFRKNESVNPTRLIGLVCDPNAEGFIRKGGAGGWREWFDAEMAAQAQAWMRAQLAGTDLRFPDHP